MTRRVNLLEAEKFMMTYDHAQLTDPLTVKLYKVPAGRSLRITRASYINPTGLAADNTNAMELDLKNNTTVIALVFNTDGNDTVPGAAIPANTFIEATLSATDGDRVLAAGDILSAVFTEDGSATLPAGHLVIEGLLL